MLPVEEMRKLSQMVKVGSSAADRTLLVHSQNSIAPRTRQTRRVRTSILKCPRSRGMLLLLQLPLQGKTHQLLHLRLLQKHLHLQRRR